MTEYVLPFTITPFATSKACTGTWLCVLPTEASLDTSLRKTAAVENVIVCPVSAW